MARHTWLGLLRGGVFSSLGLLTLVIGCDRSSNSPPATRPAWQLATERPKLTVILPEAENWSAAEATARLLDNQAGISAAVRLVHLCGLEPLCVPAGMTDATASCLRLVELSDELWALGLRDALSQNVLHAPVLVGRDGEVTQIAEGTEEELLRMHIAADPEVFPHLLISPRRVWMTRLPLAQALALDGPDCVGFCWREDGGFPYVGLLGGHNCNFAEITRYLWEPYEFAFTGPAMDALPDPPGGKFQLDLGNSPQLIPMGGEIPEPKPLPAEPPPNRGDDLAAAVARFRLEPFVEAWYRIPAEGWRPTFPLESCYAIG
jgi:hypothetical protein